MLPREELDDAMPVDEPPGCVHPVATADAPDPGDTEALLRYARAVAVPCPCCAAVRWWPCDGTGTGLLGYHRSREARSAAMLHAHTARL